MTSRPRVYLDHHATTPLSPSARAAMAPLWEPGFVGNPSSAHREGRRARGMIDDARRAVAAAIGAAPSEVTFTSGGTEATHLAVRGLGLHPSVTSLWCDPGAHPCVVSAMESLGLPVRWVPSDLDAFAAVLEPGALVATAWVQHETGAIADVPGLGRLLAAHGARWVLDGVQALGKIPVAVTTAGAHAVTFSAHKLGGPQGVGALWARGTPPLATVMGGGGQERGLRGGTENLAGIVGFGAAAREAPSRLAAMGAVAALRDEVERTLVALGASATVGGPRVATVTHVAWRDAVDGAELVAAFDVEGVAVSSGSACSSGRARRSASIARLFPGEPWRAGSALRVSLSPGTSPAEVARFVEVAREVVPRFVGAAR